MTRICFACHLCLLASCASLNSSTTIRPKDRFVLGNNPHGSFRVHLINTSSNEVTVYQAPVGGGKHSSQTVFPGQHLRVKVDRNTALVVANNAPDTAVVKLKVTGDTGLSMQYGQ
jgi:hypothetical protein